MVLELSGAVHSSLAEILTYQPLHVYSRCHGNRDLTWSSSQIFPFFDRNRWFFFLVFLSIIAELVPFYISSRIIFG